MGVCVVSTSSIIKVLFKPPHCENYEYVEPGSCKFNLTGQQEVPQLRLTLQVDRSIRTTTTNVYLCFTVSHISVTMENENRPIQ